MTIGFIVECSQLGPEEILVGEMMHCFCPKDKTIVLPKINKGILLANAVSDAAKLLKQGCKKVFILWDWHPREFGWGETKKKWSPGACRTEAAKMRNDLHQIGLTNEQVILVCVTQEVEAWALADKNAIKDRLTKRLKNHAPPGLTVKKTSKPEEESDPERRLENLFLKYDVEMVKHEDVPEIFKNAARNCFSAWDTCPSFVRFVDRLIGVPGGFTKAVQTCQQRPVG